VFVEATPDKNIMHFLPRDEHFYQLFLNHIDKTVQAASLLAEAADSGQKQRPGFASRIQTLEQEADDIIHDIYVRLNSTFITPIDPEDIHSLSSSLDDILDGIEECSYRLVAYQIANVPPPMVELSRIILRSVRTLERAFTALSRNASLTEACIEVNRLEQVADDLGREAVTLLFSSEKDCIQLIKLKEIYEVLEETVDHCEDVADALQNVMVKNS
jgi:predicted phosphate transport protein (TIGR00153 family)